MIRAGKLTVILLWLLAAVWLIRFEAFPELFSGSTLSYRNIISQDILLRESWHKITMQGRDIGYVFTSISSENPDQQKSIDIVSKIHINLGLPVRTDDIVLESTIRLNSDYSVQSVDTDLQAPGVNLRNMIEHLEARRYKVNTFRSDSNASSSREMTLPASFMVFIPPTDLIPPRLRAGVKAYMRVLDPVSLDVSTVEAETVTPGKGIGTGLARTHHWTRITHRGLDLICARDSTDDVVYIKAPLGISLRKCTADEAFDAAGLGDTSTSALQLSPEKVSQYVESIIGPLSSVIKFQPSAESKENDQDK